MAVALLGVRYEAAARGPAQFAELLPTLGGTRPSRRHQAHPQDQPTNGTVAPLLSFGLLVLHRCILRRLRGALLLLYSLLLMLLLQALSAADMPVGGSLGVQAGSPAALAAMAVALGGVHNHHLLLFLLPVAGRAVGRALGVQAGNTAAVTAQSHSQGSCRRQGVLATPRTRTPWTGPQTPPTALRSSSAAPPSSPPSLPPCPPSLRPSPPSSSPSPSASLPSYRGRQGRGQDPRSAGRQHGSGDSNGHGLGWGAQQSHSQGSCRRQGVLATPRTR
eukprot:439181_1